MELERMAKIDKDGIGVVQSVQNWATHFKAIKNGRAKSVVSLLEAQKVGAQMRTLHIRLYRPCLIKVDSAFNSLLNTPSQMRKLHHLEN